ncbi:MAG: serine/threonine-protein kinase [Cyanobacteriota bacterium]|nr:serine/threonine-protein kinase [Cyanobacteriota bacterium]
MKDELFDRGYEVIRELNSQENGRISYQAIARDNNEQVAIKQFNFADGDASWASFEAGEREKEIIKDLQHPRIPRYLDFLETPQGYCLVTEYKSAPTLAKKRRFTPEQIKQIAISVLEILVYLQKQKPPVVHGDIKPENILVDDRLNAYLINFGSAQRGDGEIFNSDLGSTAGFISPEQQLNGTVTIASDLYSLGATLMCLLTGTSSDRADKLLDRHQRFNPAKQVPGLSALFIVWLEKMLAPNPKDRFEKASAALEALKPIPVFGDRANFGTMAKALAPLRVATLLAIASMSLVTALSTSLILSQQRRPVTPRQKIAKKIAVTTPTEEEQTLAWKLLATKECQQCNLRQVELPGGNLSKANLRGANLMGANLKGAIFKKAMLQGTILDYAKLQGARLNAAKLQGASLVGANLQGANLVKANLRGADLRNANLQGAKLDGANLEGASLEGAVLPRGSYPQ